MSAYSSQSDWKRLFRIAVDLIRQVNSEQPVIDDWRFGGGTAMMLQINHRESQDIDIFLSDPQVLSFLEPQKGDFSFEIPLAGYRGDGSQFLKLTFGLRGNIDFIVAPSLTRSPTASTLVEGTSVLLETVPEIITKKIYYRGSHPQPRDIFDIAAAGVTHANSVIEELRHYRSHAVRTLASIDKMNIDFVNAAISRLAISESYRPIAKTAIERTKEILGAV